MADNKLESIIDNPLQQQLFREFFDSRYFGTQHWFAARAEILALRERISELENPKQKGRTAASVPADKTEQGD